MDFEITPEQQELSAAVRAFAREALNLDLERRDHDETFPRDCWQKCADFGLLGLPVPAEYGGQGQDLEIHGAAASAVSGADRSLRASRPRAPRTAVNAGVRATRALARARGAGAAR